MSQIALMKRHRRIGCTAHALQLGTLGGGRSAFAGGTLAAADGFPGWGGGGEGPVGVGLDGGALAGSVGLLDGC